MIPQTMVKTGQLIAPQAIVDDAYYAGSHQHGSINTGVDTNGWDFISIYFWLGATDIAVAELSLYHSTDNTTFTQIAASNFNGTAGTLPSATADNTGVAWHVALNNGTYNRYFRINAKNGNGAAGGYATAWYVLSRGVNAPNSASERGLAQEVFML